MTREFNLEAIAAALADGKPRIFEHYGLRRKCPHVLGTVDRFSDVEVIVNEDGREVVIPIDGLVYVCSTAALDLVKGSFGIE